MAKPVMVTSCVLPAAMVAIVAFCLIVSPPGSVRVAVTGTSFSVTSALVLDLDDEGEVGRGRDVVGLALDERDVAGAALGDDVDEADAVDAGELGRVADVVERRP